MRIKSACICIKDFEPTNLHKGSKCEFIKSDLLCDAFEDITLYYEYVSNITKFVDVPQKLFKEHFIPIQEHRELLINNLLKNEE